MQSVDIQIEDLVEGVGATRGVRESAASSRSAIRKPRSGALDDLGIGNQVAHLKRYQIIRCVGEGGMGRVYQAYDPVLRRDIALKVMKPNVPETERRRFRREAIYGARFLHPCVTRVFDMGQMGSRDSEWFSMEFLSGSDLERIVDRARERGRRLPLISVLDVFRQVLTALQYCHDCNVVHRDIKPSNIFVTRDPNTRFMTTKLLDFGIAIDLESQQVQERLCGDPFYMAPEQTRTHTPIDARADIYAAGITLYEVVTGLHPFGSLRDAPLGEIFGAQREYTPPAMSRYMPGGTTARVAHGLDMIFAQACAKDPNERFSSAREMLEAMMVALTPKTMRAGPV